MFEKEPKKMKTSIYQDFKNSINSISTIQRLLIIIQLCITCSLILWYSAQPFMGDYFNLRSRMLLYEYAMGISNTFNAPNHEKLQRNTQRWDVLPATTKTILSQDYEQLQAYAQRHFQSKIKEGIEILFKHIPSFELAWILLATVLSLLLLFRVEGAKQATWLLPLLICAYVIDNQLNGNAPKKSADFNLFPTESFIIQNYVKSTLSVNLEEQRKQLKDGWEAYLSKNWSSSSNLEEGEFNFTIARLQAFHVQPLQAWRDFFHERSHPFILIIYLIWNFLFAKMLNKRSPVLINQT